MIFAGITFLYYFLPIVLILYFIVPNRYKNLILLIASLVFYGWGEPKFLFIMLISIFVGYITGILIEKNINNKYAKIYLILSIFIDLAVLVYFKYTNFLINNFNYLFHNNISLLNIALPIGISFYTFQIISYLIDVYRREVPAQKNIIHLATYISMFPQLIAGPIVRYKDVEKQLNNRDITIDKIALGIRRFVLGMSKKVLIANQLGNLCNIFKNSQDLSVLYFWLYAISFMLQIYFDFSGYSDMAIGLGKIFGFNFIENFNYPYISKTITEFWRRWHISLGSWFRDYVYIPLGGNRVSKKRHFFNIFIIWFLTGFWHGAEWNFIIWGLLFGVLLIIEKEFLFKSLNKAKLFNHFYVLFIVLISFVIFDSTNLNDVLFNMKSMFGFSNIPFVSKEFVYYFHSYLFTIIFAIIGSTSYPKIIYNKISNNLVYSKVSSIIEPIILIFLTILVTAYLIDGSFNPFLYFRF